MKSTGNVSFARCPLSTTLFKYLRLFISATGDADVSFMFPVLLAKNWILGYVLVAVGVVLGALAVCWPNKRKLSEISPNYKSRR